MPCVPAQQVHNHSNISTMLLQLHVNDNVRNTRVITTFSEIQDLDAFLFVTTVNVGTLEHTIVDGAFYRFLKKIVKVLK
jgi:hypothetical protein